MLCSTNAASTVISVGSWRWSRGRLFRIFDFAFYTKQPNSQESAGSDTNKEIPKRVLTRKRSSDVEDEHDEKEGKKHSEKCGRTQSIAVGDLKARAAIMRDNI